MRSSASKLSQYYEFINITIIDCDMFQCGICDCRGLVRNRLISCRCFHQRPKTSQRPKKNTDVT